MELCRQFGRQAATDGLISADLDPDDLAVVTDLLVSADTTVHLRRTRGWSASAHRRLVVDALTTLAPSSAT